ncbi:hypothetical protein RU639_002544 [Aspergillus parasiticus]
MPTLSYADAPSDWFCADRRSSILCNLAVSHSGCGTGPPHTHRLGQGDDWLNNDAENPPELPEGGDTAAPDPFLNVLWHSGDNDMQASSKLA